MEKSEESSEEKISISLLGRLYEAHIYMGYPTYDEIKNENAKERPPLMHLGCATGMIGEFMDKGKFNTASHIARITLYNLAVCDFLGMHEKRFEKSRDISVAAALHHDDGKLLLDDLVEKIHFTKEDLERMKNHVQYSAFGESETDQIISLHHFWQTNSYASWQKEIALKNPKMVALSKILGIIDFYDSCSTRPDRITKKLISQEEAKKATLAVYGSMPIIYRGSELPALNLNGERLINDLFNEGIFGRDALNPFPIPYSFIWRHRRIDAIEQTLKSIEREIQIEEKNAKY